MLAEIRARLIRNVMVIFITVVVTFLTTEYWFSQLWLHHFISAIKIHY